MNRNNNRNSSERFNDSRINNGSNSSWSSNSNYGTGSNSGMDDDFTTDRDFNLNSGRGNRSYGNGSSEYERDYNRGNYSTNNYGRNSDFGGRNDFNRNFQNQNQNLNQGYGRNEFRNTEDHFSMGNQERGFNQRSYGGNRYQSADSYGENFGQGGMNSGNRWQTNSQQERSGFWGKGPKGYRRSDDRIKEDVCEALYHDNMVDASEIEVSVKEGTVTLSGTVTDRDSKRAAERCVESLSGVDDVRNDIRVSRDTGMNSGSQDSQKNDKGQIRKLS